MKGDQRVSMVSIPVSLIGRAQTCMLKMQAILMAQRIPSRHRDATSGSSQSCSPTLKAASRGVHASCNGKRLLRRRPQTEQEAAPGASNLEHGSDVLQVRGAEERRLGVAHGLHQRFGRLRHLLHLHVVEQPALLLAGDTCRTDIYQAFRSVEVCRLERGTTSETREDVKKCD